MNAGRLSFLSIIFIFALLLCGDTRAQFSDINVNHLVVFGDSYTADGSDNINGPKWVRQLANAWSNTTLLNYAVGGALCNDTPSTASHSSVEKQATLFLQNSTRFDPNTTVYSIFVGINDMVNGVSAPDVVACIHGEMLRLNQQVQGTHFLIFNMVPFHRSPRILLDNTVAQSQQWIQQFNQLLNSTLAQMQGFDIVLIDNFNVVSNVLDNPANFGITQNITDYYLRTHSKTSPNIDQEANQYAWFDITHVTNIVHQQITAAITGQQPFQSIPLARSPSLSLSAPNALSRGATAVTSLVFAVATVCLYVLF